MKSFSKIAGLFTLMLKIMTLITLARPNYIKANKNIPNIDNSNSIGSDNINNKIANLSNNIKK